MPAVNVDVLDGQLAWRQHDGGHTDAPNVKYFISWAEPPNPWVSPGRKNRMATVVDVGEVDRCQSQRTSRRVRGEWADEADVHHDLRHDGEEALDVETYKADIGLTQTLGRVEDYLAKVGSL